MWIKGRSCIHIIKATVVKFDFEDEMQSLFDIASDTVPFATEASTGLNSDDYCLNCGVYSKYFNGQPRKNCNIAHSPDCCDHEMRTIKNKLTIQDSSSCLYCRADYHNWSRCFQFRKHALSPMGPDFKESGGIRRIVEAIKRFGQGPEKDGVLTEYNDYPLCEKRNSKFALATTTLTDFTKNWLCHEPTFKAGALQDTAPKLVGQWQTAGNIIIDQIDAYIKDTWKNPPSRRKMPHIEVEK